MKDYGTKRVEPVWAAPFRRYAPAALVLCLAVLITIAVLLPIHSASPSIYTTTSRLLLALVYLALLALASFLVITARQQEVSKQVDLQSASELYGLNERLHTTLRSIGEGVISTDVDGRVTLMNEVAVRMTGWQPGKAIGRPVSDVFRVLNEESLRAEDNPVGKLMTPDVGARMEKQGLLESIDQTRAPIAYCSAPILDADEWMMGAVIVFRDISQLREAQRQREELIAELSEANEKLRSEIDKSEKARRAALSLMQDAQMAQEALRKSEERLKASNAALEEYARVASHDLQEPLRKIETFSQVLTEDFGPKLDVQAREYLDIMVDAAKRMRRLIRDVLAFSKAGAEDVQFEDVDLNHVMEIVSDNLSARIAEKSAKLTWSRLPVIHGNETQMVQLFQNLVGNGLKFNNRKNPAVEVKLDGTTPAFWKILIRDNGIGIRSTEKAMIFAPFKRLHAQDRYEGTGIGLAICKKIVARHGGTIGVDSEPGRGSVFWLTLPFSEAGKSGTTESAGPARPQRKDGEAHEPSHAGTDSNTVG